MNEINPYDSERDTLAHIQSVQVYMIAVIMELLHRTSFHDLSKLESPEKDMFDRVTPLLRNTTYGSDEYKTLLAEMGEVLSHHYRENSHHPEHYENGINDMTLIDLIEMLCDWMAATLRHEDGDIIKSLEINGERFNISEQLLGILRNTVLRMEWI